MLCIVSGVAVIGFDMFLIEILINLQIVITALEKFPRKINLINFFNLWITEYCNLFSNLF